MKISLVQQDIIWKDREANLLKLEGYLASLHGKTDLVILPEMFSTGFSVDPEGISEEPAGKTMLWMKKMASEGNFAVCGSYITAEDQKFYNRLIFATPEGASYSYDKRHLFAFAGEQQFFSEGSERLILKFRDVRICLMICYDLRFPVWSRNLKEYDLMVYCANWPKSRNLAWNTLIRARAIENQCYVAAVNRVGRDGSNTSHCGESALIEFSGETLATAGIDMECTVTGEISMQKLSEYRQKFPFLDDADQFEIIK
jgi:omega-amidase